MIHHSQDSFFFQKTQTLKVEKGVLINSAFPGEIYLFEDSIKLNHNKSMLL
jgi:hypothetical protein